MHIDNDQRQEHFFRVDLVDGAEAFNEMSRRIYVRSPLAHVREQFREKTGAHRVGTLVRHGGSVLWRIVPVNCLARFIRKTGPARNSRRKLVRKIDVFLRRQHLLDFPKWFIIGTAHR
jgi:hypothetical protein